MYEDLFASTNSMGYSLFDSLLDEIDFKGTSAPEEMIYGRGALYFNSKAHPWLTIEGGL